MKKIILFTLFLMLMCSLVSAEVYMTTDSRLPTNGNLEIYFSSSSGLYALEVNLPLSFIIVSDPSSGVIKNGVYRTTYANDLKLVVRVAPQEGNYQISGKYTDGSGVKSFDTKTVEVYNSITSEIRCPVCPSDTLWSTCVEGRQSRELYSCGSQTNYVCVKNNEFRSCSLDQNTTLSSCTVGWACIDDNTLALQNADCGYSTTLECKQGCDVKNNKCSSGNLISGAVVGVNESGGKAFNWLGNLFTGLINWLKNLFSFKL